MAPEVLQGARYNHKVDVWSLGTIFYEMLTGFPPFTGRDQRDLQDNLRKGYYNFPKHIKLSLEGFDFLNCCLQYDPQQRMAWDELLRHGYVNEKAASPENDGLFLSFNPDSGNYQALVRDRPQFNMNEHNATLINTRNPQYFERICDKVLQKHFEARQLEQKAELGAVESELKKMEVALGKS